MKNPTPEGQPAATPRRRRRAAARVPQDESPEPGKKQKTTAQLLVEIAEEWNRFGRTEQGRPFAVEIDGPNIALGMGGKEGRFSARLAGEFYKRHRRPPNSSALADAQRVLIGRALDENPEEVWIRTGRAPDGSIVLDLGDESGRCVIVGPDGWRVADRSPILFRRTTLTVAWPVPSPGGSLAKLSYFINSSAETFDLIVAWIVSSYVPDIAHPVVLLSGEHGSIKSSASRALAQMVDPTSALIRKVPKDAEAWSVTAAGSWGVALDNLSNIPEWLSDALCRASTGDADVRRKLYEDDGLFVEAFRRVVLLNGIEVGGVRGDLADRMLLVECGRLNGSRKEEAAVNAAFAKLWPKFLGAAFDLLSAYLAAQRDGTNRLSQLPRMADFARVVRAVDMELGTGALDTYREQHKRVAIDVADDDVVSGPLRMVLDESSGRFVGTADELLLRLNDHVSHIPHGWPKSAKTLASRLSRLAPGYREAGWTVEKRPSNGRKLWEIALPDVERPRTGRKVRRTST